MNNKQLALSWAILDVFCLASFVVLSKFILNTWADPFNFAFQILLVASILIFIFWKYTKQNFAIKKKELFHVIWISIMLWAVWYWLFFIWLNNTTAINASFLWNSWVIFTILISYYFLKEKISIRILLLVILLLIWCYGLSTWWKAIIPEFWDLIVLCHSLNYSIWIILSKKLLEKMSPVIFSFYRAFFWWIFIFIWILVFWELDTSISISWILIQWSIIAWWLIAMNKVLEYRTASYLTQFTTISPILVSLSALFLLWESMNAIQIVWAIVILSSVYLLHKFGY